MPDAAALAGRREHAISEVERVLCTEGGFLRRLPNADAEAMPRRGFVAGWELSFRPVERIRRLNLYVDSSFPFSVPRLLLVDPPPFLTWPHIEEDGVLCLDPRLTVDPSQPVGVVQYLLKSAHDLLVDSELRKNQDDFRAEFQSYWYWKRSEGTVPVYSLLEPHGPSRKASLWRGQGVWVAGENEGAVLRWLRNWTGNQKEPGAAEASCILWLERPPLPAEYSERPTDVWKLARSAAGGTEVLSEVVSEDRDSFAFILGATSANGPCFGAVKLSSAVVRNVMGRDVNSTGKGFRRGHVPRPLLAQRMFNAPGQVSRSEVQRADPSWIHGRDRDPRYETLRTCRVAVVGCGAIGAPVAIQLAMAGVGAVLMIDPEVLKWSNVGRHPLGAGSVDKSKSSELAKKLTSDFPHAVFESRWQSLGETLFKEPQILQERDLIVCATGIWGVESAMNAWQMSENVPRHIVYSWMEPHACAGHAVGITKGGPCLQCHFSAVGDSDTKVTDWPEAAPTSEPACGAIYQPYGPVELSWITALAAGLALDCLLGKIPKSTHRIWAGPRALLDAAGGYWNRDWVAARREREMGGFQEELPWAGNATCPICS